MSARPRIFDRPIKTPASLETDTYSDFQYDTLGRMTRGPDANWYAADTRYDPLDRPIKFPDGRGRQWDTVYDANGNPLMVGLTIAGAYLEGGNRGRTPITHGFPSACPPHDSDFRSLEFSARLMCLQFSCQ